MAMQDVSSFHFCFGVFPYKPSEDSDSLIQLPFPLFPLLMYGLV